MLIYRLQRSMDLVLEGIDQCDVPLIIEASQAFTDGHKTVLETIKQFISVLEDSDFGNILGETIVKKIKEFEKDLEAIDLKKIPEKFSFKANAELYGSIEDKGSTGIQTLTTTASSFDCYYSGIKDAIIEIAKELENFNDVFSVGSNGIVLTKEFAKVDKIEDKLTLMSFSFMPPEEMATFLATGQEGTDEKWKEVFSEELTNIATKLGDPAEKADDAIQEFLDMFETIGNSIRQLADQVVKTLVDAKPTPEIQNAVKKQGFLASLFKKSNPYDIETKVAQVITEALLRLPITNFWKLTQGLIKMSKGVDAAMKGAITGSSEQAKKIQEVPKEAAKFKQEVNDEVHDKDQANKISVGMEELGKKEGVKEDSYDYSKIDPEKIKALLTDAGLDDNEIKDFLNKFGYTGDDPEEEPEISPEVEELVQEIEEEAKEDLPRNEAEIEKSDQKEKEQVEKLTQIKEKEIPEKSPVAELMDALQKKITSMKNAVGHGDRSIIQADEISKTGWEEIFNDEEFINIGSKIRKAKANLLTVYGMLNPSSDLESAQKECEGYFSEYKKAEEALSQWWESGASPEYKKTNEIFRRWGVLAGIIKG